MTDPTIYDGLVVFVEGVHYPVTGKGTADLSRPLRLADGGGWRDAVKGEPLHNDQHLGADLELDPGGES